jgi:probable addiction module antidote protein
MVLKTHDYDPTRHLDTEEAIEEYLLATCEDGGPGEIARALGAVARVRGIADLSRKTGLTRQSLYKALSGEGSPEFGMIARVAEALGFRLTLARAGDWRQNVA